MLTQTRIAGLKCYVAGDHTHKGSIAAVILHGYGANGLDLAGLSQEIKTPEGTFWIFPEAPISVPIGMGTMGKAWFEIDLMALQVAMQEGSLLDYYESQGERIASARDSILNLLNEISHPLDQTVIGGFSQGAMVSLETCLHLDQNPKSLLLYSPTFYRPTLWPQLAPKRSGLKFLQSHGIFDPVLPYDLSKSLFDMLKKFGLKGDMISFKGGHEIPYPVIEASSRYFL